jgi:hypothetical protein
MRKESSTAVSSLRRSIVRGDWVCLSVGGRR